MKILKKLGIPVAALAGMLALFNPSAANAKARVWIGPAYPYYQPYPYYGFDYGYPYDYGPYVTWGWGGHHYHHEHHH
jgi:hypothetical protein